jgi:hypothetical protein
MNFIIRFVLTALLVYWAALPFLDHTTGSSTLNDIYQIGIIPSVLIMLAFFVMVAFYCSTLQKCLQLIKPENRKTSPQSVWYMFALPFNFVEDFFIVINLANSLEKEKASNEKLNNVTDFGMISGIGWCLAQVLSFVPNIVGQVAGLLGMILVIYHWILINRLKKRLEEPQK